MDNSPNDIFGKDLSAKEEKIEPVPSPTGNKGIMHNHTFYSISANNYMDNHNQVYLRYIHLSHAYL